MDTHLERGMQSESSNDPQGSASALRAGQRPNGPQVF